MKRALVLAALSAVVACGGEEQFQQGGGRLEAAYAEASEQFGVPAVVLKAVGKVETNWFHAPNSRSLDGGFGLMHLTEGEAGTLRRAALLTGLSERELKEDARANILGAAAVLRDLFDEAQAREPGLSSLDPADFWEPLRAYAGIADPDVALMQLELYYAAMVNGAERSFAGGERVVLPATPVNLTRRPLLGEQRFALRPDYPGARWVSANSGNYTVGRGGNSISYVIIHTVQGSYAGCVSWFQNPSAKASAHYVVPQNPLSPPLTQMVENKDTAWHAGNWSYNQRSVGIENEGWVSDPNWATENTYCVSAKLTRWLCDSYHFPCDRAHVLGHIEVPGATHTDPGKYWNWTKFMAYVNGGCGATPTQGTLVGVVYKDPDVNARIGGATVRLNTGQATTADGTGVYKFTGLAAGTYTATASAPGYKDNSVTRAVVVGQETWGSIGLFADNGMGKFKGFVYEGEISQKQYVANAEVRLDGGAWRAVGDRGLTGFFEFETAPGVHTVAARAPGYQENSSTRTVAASSDIWGSIRLDKAAAVPPRVHIDAPKDKTVLEIADVEIRGSIENSAGIDTIRIRFAGKEVTGPVSSGAFQVPITVPPGETTIEAVASNAAGEGKAAITVTFKSGLCGFVFELPGPDGDGGGESARIAGAKVELFGADLCSAAAATATTGADGSYCLDVPAGTYTMKVSAADHRAGWEQLEVPANRREQVKTGLAQGTDPAPSIVILEPELDESFAFETDAATVDVHGGVYGLEPQAVTVNGVAADIAQDGSFAAVGVPLPAGDSTLEIVAQGHCGESASLTVTAHRLAGPPPPPAEDGACGCAAGSEGVSLIGLVGLAGLLRRRRSSNAR